jgi:hypothetical protein
LLDRPAMDPDFAPSVSHPAFSLAVHDSVLGVEFVNVTDAVVPAVPKATIRGETWNFTDPPAISACDSMSTGEEDVQAAARAAKEMAMAARRARREIDST